MFLKIEDLMFFFFGKNLRPGSVLWLFLLDTCSRRVRKRRLSVDCPLAFAFTVVGAQSVMNIF